MNKTAEKSFDSIQEEARHNFESLANIADLLVDRGTFWDASKGHYVQEGSGLKDNLVSEFYITFMSGYASSTSGLQASYLDAITDKDKLERKVRKLKKKVKSLEKALEKSPQDAVRGGSGEVKGVGGMVVPEVAKTPKEVLREAFESTTTIYKEIECMEPSVTYSQTWGYLLHGSPHTYLNGAFKMFCELQGLVK